MSGEEEAYLSHLLSADNQTTQQELLLSIAESLYGKKVKVLTPKPSDNTIVGETLLHEKAIQHLKLQMEHLHYSVTQTAYNMWKLAEI